MVMTSEYEGLRSHVFNDYISQFQLHVECAHLIHEMMDIYVDQDSSLAWSWKMRLEWHERMKTSLKSYLTRHYRARQPLLLRLFTKEPQIEVDQMSENHLKSKILQSVSTLKKYITSLLTSEAVPRQVDDMMNDHLSIVETLYSQE